MKTLSPRKLAVALAIAALLAAMTMGNISICDVVVGVPEEADTLRVTVPAGQTAKSILSGYHEEFRALFRLCPPGVIQGVYPVTHFFGDKTGVRIVDLATSSTSPPGHYLVNYTESRASLPFRFPVLAYGILDLTITPAPAPLDACFYAEAEIIQVGVPVTFNATCSSGPIVQYKWWFNYDGYLYGTPSATTSGPTTQTTYASAGERTVRLVVRTAGGEEAEIIHTYAVQPGPYAVQGAP